MNELIYTYLSQNKILLHTQMENHFLSQMATKLFLFSVKGSSLQVWLLVRAILKSLLKTIMFTSIGSLTVSTNAIHMV